jgi:hypothetical protein
MMRLRKLLVVFTVSALVVLAQTGIASAKGSPPGPIGGCTNPLWSQMTCIQVWFTGTGPYTVTKIRVGYGNSTSSTQCGYYAVENANDAFIYGPTSTRYCYGPGKYGSHYWYPNRSYASGFTFCAEFSSTAQEACGHLP